MPHSDAGWRIEPPVSVPSAHGAVPEATAAALPPDEPPGTRVRSHGFSTGPKAGFPSDGPMDTASWLHWASSVVPAAVSFSTTVAVCGGSYPASSFEPACDGT